MDDQDVKPGSPYEPGSASPTAPPQVQQASPGPVQAPTAAQATPWYFEWWFIIIALIFIGWPGLIPLWMSPLPKKNAKVTLTVVFVILPVLLFCGLFAAFGGAAYLAETGTAEVTQQAEPAVSVPEDQDQVAEPPTSPSLAPTDPNAITGEGTLTNKGLADYSASGDQLESIFVWSVDPTYLEAAAMSRVDPGFTDVMEYKLEGEPISEAEAVRLLDANPSAFNVDVRYYQITETGQMVFVMLDLHPLE